MKKKIVIAHRGASALAAHENTLESFGIAISLGADMVEFDIRRTRDKKLIVFHDKHYKGKKICQYTYSELNQLTEQEHFRVPLLEEVLELCQGKIRLDIELKESGYENEVVTLVKQLYPNDEFFIKSFKDEVVSKIKEIDEKITAGLLLGDSNRSLRDRLMDFFPADRLASCHADFVSPCYQLLNPAFMWRMHNLEIPIYPWTVNNSNGLWYQLHTGIHGIITDRPDIALAIRR